MKLIKIIFLLTVMSLFSYANNKPNFTTQELDYIKNNPTVVVGGETDWPPYDFVKDGKYQGIAKEYLDLISKKTGLKFDIKTGYTWPKLLALSKKEQIDLLPILTNLPDRAKFLNFTKDYITTRQYAFSNEDITFKKIEDLYGKRIAIPEGYASITTIKKKYPKIIIIESKNVLNSIDLLVTRRVDAIIENNALVNFLLKDQNISGIKPQFGINLASDKLAMGIIKSKPILRDIIQKALDSISRTEKHIILNKTNSKKAIKNPVLLTEEELLFIKEHPIVRIANEISWKPYDFNENNQAKGYSIDLIKLLTSKVGLETKFITDSWADLTTGFNNNTIDVFPVISKSKKREESMLFTDSYMNLNQAIIIRNTEKNVNSLSDLKGKKVAVVESWNSTKILKMRYPEINFVAYKNIVEKLDAVAYGRVDATIDGFVSANYLIAENFLNNLKIIKKIELPSFDNRQYIGIRKELPILRSILQKSLMNVTDIEMHALNSKWQNIPSHNTQLDLTFAEQEFIKNNVIKMSGSKKWAPFIFTDKNDSSYGIIIDYWDLIAKKAGLDYEIKLFDVFKDSLMAIKNKEVDILSSGETKERKEYSIFSMKVEGFPLSLATLESEQYISSIKTLMNKKIAVGKNFTAHKILKKVYPQLNLILTDNTPDALKLVSAGEAFAAVDAAPTLIYYINHLGLTNIKISGHTGENFDLKFMIRDDYPILKSIVNKAIKNISPPEKQKIYNKWIAVNYQQQFDYSLFWKTFGVLAVVFAFFFYRHLQLLKYQKMIKRTNDQLTKQSLELEKSNDIIHETQNELESSLDNFITLVDSTIEAILITENEKIIYVNDEAVKLFGVETKVAFMNKDILTFFTQEAQENIKEIINSEETTTHEIIAKRNNGEAFPAMVKSKSLQFQNIHAKTISIIDLTDLKNKETLIKEQSKMAAIGEMIGNIAHQWRQPLSIISTSASAMELYKNSDKLNDEIFFRSTNNILKNTEFLSQTIDDFRDFIKTNKKYVYFNIDSAIEKTIVLIGATLKNFHIQVELDLEKDINLHNYENELIQALLNIINNSKDALKDKEIEDKLIFITAYRKDDKAIIEIKDNGGGISHDAIGHIFEPYYTTKHKSMGTGLGLYMTHKIIFDSMSGSINVKNTTFMHNDKSNKGALFILTLPIDSVDINSKT